MYAKILTLLSSISRKSGKKVKDQNQLKNVHPTFSKCNVSTASPGNKSNSLK